YDRELDNIFEVQAEIAASVVRQLQATLLGSVASPGHTPSAEAYTAYLQGKYFAELASGHRASETRDKAIAYYEQALQLDERYAAAMVSLAVVRFGPNFGVRTDADVVKARQLIDRAIALDPQLAVAYALRARIARAYDFNWAAAEASLKRARELEPGNIFVLREAS